MGDVASDEYKAYLAKSPDSWSLFDWACFYRYRLGLSVFPLQYGSKRPAVSSWEPYQHRPPTAGELFDWFVGREANIAVVCGRVSGNLVVMDFDDVASYEEFFKAREKLEESTLVCRTARGVHVYLRSTEPVRTFKIQELKLDIKGEGSYVVAPPSLHPSGVRYEFVNFPGVQNIIVVEGLVASIKRRVRQLGADIERMRLSGEELTELLKKAKAWRGGTRYSGPHPPCVLKALQGVPEGFRNETCVWLAAYFLNFRGMSVEETREILYGFADRCEPPLSHSEVNLCIESVLRHGYNFSCSNYRVRAFCSPGGRLACPVKRWLRRRRIICP